MSTDTSVAGRTILITGANRGLGLALVEECLRRGAARVYAGTRQPFTHPDERVTPVSLDITDAAQIAAAAKAVEDLDVLINNAGLAGAEDLADRAVLERHLAVNYFGPHAVTYAFLPQLTRSGGTLVNVLSVTAVAAVPVLPSYSASKAAAFSLTQSLRAVLAGEGVRVHAVLAGPLDTEMARHLDVPKALVADVAAAILDGVAAGEEDIFPDPMSAMLAEGWPSGAIKTLERENAAQLATLLVAQD